ncbi:MAG: hypothetical protein AB1744_02200 [Candidatus Zixiibacteriota bacterium]
MSQHRLLLPLAAALLVAVFGCSPSSTPTDPKSTVIAMFGAMEKDDKATLAHLLDLAELMRNYQEDYALQTDSPRVFTSPEQILDDLTGDGLTKRRWFAMQRIISEVNILGESATVDVTFVDKEQSRGYRTTFGVHMVNGRWKIYSFKTIQGDG